MRKGTGVHCAPHKSMSDGRGHPTITYTAILRTRVLVQMRNIAGGVLRLKFQASASSSFPQSCECVTCVPWGAKLMEGAVAVRNFRITVILGIINRVCIWHIVARG